MQPAICLLPVVPVRKEPSHRSEMVSQLLFGEYVSIGEEKDDFIYTTCLHDGYEGWVQASQLTRVLHEQILSTTTYIGVFGEEVFIDGLCRMIPFGVPVYDAIKAGEPLQFGNRQILYHVSEDADWNSTERAFTKENLDHIVRIFLGTPYLWGGKSVYGIDCSGFAQQVFKLFGVKLLRDAYLQAGQGEPVASLEDSQRGDLVFFQNEKGRVMHVGILLNNHEIVHASGKVRIDIINEEGITNRETGKRTHQFHSIRRFF